MTSFRKTLVGAAVTAATRASPGTITIPGDKGGVLVAIELQVFGTLETVVNSGGLVELENDAVDWKPFQFYTHGLTVVTSGAAKAHPTRIPVHKRLPPNSTVTIHYTPQDDQSQKLAVTLCWETDINFNEGQQTFAMTGIGDAITQVTVAAKHVTIAIPAEKGGTLRAIQVQVWGTLETVVNSGGLVAITNDSADMTPFEFYTQSQTCVTCGAVELEPATIPCTKPCPSRSNMYADYTPQDNQSQKLSMTLIWTKS